jgi:hypothetical protein
MFFQTHVVPLIAPLLKRHDELAAWLAEARKVIEPVELERNALSRLITDLRHSQAYADQLDRDRMAAELPEGYPFPTMPGLTNEAEILQITPEG